MSKVASAFLHLTETNPQEGLGGPPSLSPCGGYTLSSPVWVSPGGARSRLMGQGYTSQVDTFMNVYFIVLGHTRKWHNRIHSHLLLETGRGGSSAMWKLRTGRVVAAVGRVRLYSSASAWNANSSFIGVFSFSGSWILHKGFCTPSSDVSFNVFKSRSPPVTA